LSKSSAQIAHCIIKDLLVKRHRPKPVPPLGRMNSFGNIRNYRLSVDVFLNAVADLIASINRFKGESAKQSFWGRSQRQFVEELEISIQRGIASSAMCAMTLVEHVRRFSKNHVIPGYSSKVSQYFKDSQEHIFVQNFRNYIAHFKLSPANFMSTFSRQGDRKVFFLLSQDDLLKSDKWQPLAKKYIDGHPDGVDVEQLFESYSAKVTEFHNWVRSAVLESYGELMSGYLYYQRLLNRFDTRFGWTIMLKHVVQNRINPYAYLDSHLTKQELAEVFSLSYRSKAQVDRIIDLVDEYGACTEEIRSLVYQCFGVHES
jgi:hypothetical protein